ncbi:hypothetical protein [Saccharopolyspora sp. NPDC049357]|uniref:hypothetical protein n=1 Tax=Saccharopolyspora sp. NPDC049357 TaxID=3154507 RepID=UPI0034402879
MTEVVASRVSFSDSVGARLWACLVLRAPESQDLWLRARTDGDAGRRIDEGRRNPDHVRHLVPDYQGIPGPDPGRERPDAWWSPGFPDFSGNPGSDFH